MNWSVHPVVYQLMHPWHWLTYGQNGITLVAALSLFVNALSVYVLLKTLRAVTQQAHAADRQAEAAEEQASAARAGSKLAQQQLREATRSRRIAKQRRMIDAAVLQAVENPGFESGSRPMLGGGGSVIKAAELASMLGMTRSRVEASLQRLERRDRVRQLDGSLDDPNPYWTIVLR